MAFDAKFFFERAVRYLDKNDYTKALKYFWRTVEYEPHNSIHYCNIAGLLSEMGRFDESNQILLYVVEKVDLSLYECYFYLANNYAHMEEYELSYQYIQRYLDSSPNGEYVDEANEMLNFLSVEFDQEDEEELRETSKKKELFMQNHKAKRLLADGKYYEATKHLLDMVEKYPDFLVAKNNLSLSYFYLGNFPKALEQCQLVLAEDPANIHALSNLAIFYQQLDELDKLEEVLSMLRKIVPYDSEQLNKLATTFGILGEDELALKHIHRMLREGIHHGPALLHQGAIVAFNLSNIEQAEKWWRDITIQYPDNATVAAYYLDLIEELKLYPYKLPIVSFEYTLPFDQQIEAVKKDFNLLYEDPYLLVSFKLGMKYAEDSQRETIMVILGAYREEGVELLFRKVLVEEKSSLEMKKNAILILDEMNAKPPYSFYVSGKKEELERQAPALNNWKPSWLTILELIDEQLGMEYNPLIIYQARLLWYQFITITKENPPNIRKEAGWIAAIEYLTVPLYGKKVSFDKLAEKHGVTVPTIKKNVQLIKEQIIKSNLLKNVFYLL